ncbi:hypothetical protein D3C80_1907790 [compost metagenome]
MKMGCGSRKRSIISSGGAEATSLDKFPYYATFLSCQPLQSSYLSDILNNGIWTHHSVNAISGAVPEVVHSNRGKVFVEASRTKIKN